MKIIIYSLLGMCLLSACQKAEDEPDVYSPDSEPMQLSVSANDFTPEDGISTRATDNGATVKFESGDRVGMIITDGSGNVMIDNVPYKFDGTNWTLDTPDAATNPLYYDPEMTNYIVYFPYSEAANGVTDVAGLKAVCPVTDEQGSKDNYRASDLMLWTKTRGFGDSGIKTIVASLSHVRSSVSIAPQKAVWKLNDGSTVSYDVTAIDGIDIMYAKDKGGSAYNAEDGSFRYILPDGYTGDVRWLCDYKGKTVGGQRTVGDDAANIRYTSEPDLYMGEYTTDKIEVGDFYCVDSKSRGYLVPKDVSTETLSAHRCLGIVFYVGDTTPDNYGVLKTNNFDGNVMHGLVISLWEINQDGDPQEKAKMLWTKRTNEKIDTWIGNQTDPDLIAMKDIFKKNKNFFSGYANTYVLRKFNEDKSNSNEDSEKDKIVIPITAIDAFATKDEYKAPHNTSGWYWPSIRELIVMHGGKETLRILDAQIAKIPQQNGMADAIKIDDYYTRIWSSTEYYSNYSTNAAYYFKSTTGNFSGDGSDGKNTSYKVRPVFAF